MHIIAGKFICKPECNTELFSLVEELLEPSRAEPGCISYNFYEDKTAANQFLFFEEWQSRESRDKHFNTPYFQKFMEDVPRLIEGKALVKIYESVNIEEL